MERRRLLTISTCSCQLSTRPRQRCTSNSVTLEDKTAQHIGSYSPTTLRVVEFQLAASFQAQHGGALKTEKILDSGERKNGKIKSGGTNGKKGQRQIHVETSSGKPVAGEHCFDCCQSRTEF